MACNNKAFMQRYDYRGRPIRGIWNMIPCRGCMNCRIDKRNYWEDRLNYARKQLVSSAFVTFTYDNNHVPLNEYGQPTLIRDEISKFTDRIRSQISYHGLPSRLCFKNWRYYAVGEYGDKFHRPHYHVLFFGLDFFDAKSLFSKCWKYGLIDSLPILSGGIRYVLKYLDKQLFGDLKKKTYDDNSLVAPFSSFSTGIGSDLFYNQYDFIKKTGTYRNLAGKIRPAPQYFLNQFLATTNPFAFEKKLAAFEAHYPNANLGDDFDNYLNQQVYARERFYASMAVNHGNPAIIPDSPDYIKPATARQMLWRGFQKTKLQEFDAHSSHVLELLYEHNGDLL